MRASLTVTLLFSVLLAACASKDENSLNKHIPIDSSLKVHPGLIRQSATAEPKTDVRPATDAPAAAKPE